MRFSYGKIHVRCCKKGCFDAKILGVDRRYPAADQNEMAQRADIVKIPQNG